MIDDFALCVGILLFVAVYLLLSRSKREMVFGIIVFSNAINLLLLAQSGDPGDKSPPILDESLTLPPVDPLPQALVLTAIVIGFGMLALLIAMVYKTQSGREDATGK